MKRGNGIKGRDDRSSGIEILMTVSKQRDEDEIDPIPRNSLALGLVYSGKFDDSVVFCP